MLGGAVASEDPSSSAAPAAGILAWDGLHNVRDLGGHPTPLGRTRFGAVVRSEGLTLISEAGRAALSSFGVKTIIDLRSPAEAELEVHPFRDLPGYHSVPLLDDDAMGVVAGFPQAADVYSYMVDQRGEQLASILRAMAAGATPQLVHCKAGKDRTGVVIALLLANAEVARDSIVADYVLSDSMLRPLYDIWARQRGIDPDSLAEPMRRYPSTPEAMRAMFEHLDARYGGLRPYLLSIGLTESEQQELAQFLRETAPTVTTRPD
jgi:protein-tyrosine phosphatase